MFSLTKFRPLVASILMMVLVAVALAVPAPSAQAYVPEFENMGGSLRGTATLTGTVFELDPDGVTRIPVAGLLVRARFQDAGGENETVSSTVTDSNGNYAITGFSSGSWAAVHVSDSSNSPKIFANAYGYTQIRLAATSRQRDIRVYRLPAAAEGALNATLLVPGGAPLSQATVRFTYLDAPGVTIPNATSSSMGVVRVSNLPVGNYSAELEYGSERWLEFKLPRELTFAITANQTTTTTRTMLVNPAGTTQVSGKLLESSNNAGVSGVNVTVQGWWENSDIYSAVTASDGSWSVSQVRAGEYKVYYNEEGSDSWGPHVKPDSDIFSVPATGSLLLDPQYLTRLTEFTGSLSVTVRSEINNKPLANSRVYIYMPKGQPWAFQETRTNASGRATFTNLAAGNYTLGASNELAGEVLPDSVVVESSKSRTVTVFLPEGYGLNGTLKGQVKGPGGVPVANMSVSLEWSSPFFWGGCAGDGWGADDLTDENGYYEINNVLTGQPINLTVGNLDLGPLYGEQQKTLTLGSGITTLSDITLAPGYKLSGTVVRSDGGALPSGLSIELYDTSPSRTLMRFFNIGANGVINTKMLPDTPVKAFVRQLRCGPSEDEGVASGYLKKVGSDYVLTGSFSDATSIAKPVGDTLSLGQIELSEGGEISGKVALLVDGEKVFRSQKDFFMVIYQNDGGTWRDATKLFPGIVESWKDGSFSLKGLPPGDYKIGANEPNRTSAYDPAYIGVSGTVSSLNSAKTFTVTTTAVRGQELVMTARQPTGILNGLALNNLRSDEFANHKNLIGISRASGSRGNYQVQLGEEFAGEWFFVDLESRGASLAPQGRAQVSPFSVRLSAASTNPDQVSGWYKVSTTGVLTVPGTENFGNDFTSVVRDASEKLVGWVESTSTSASFGGFGLSIKPQLQKMPALSGKAKVGKVLKLDSGQWAGLPAPQVKVQWLRCSGFVKKRVTIRPKNCSVISGATQASFKTTTKDLGTFVTAQVVVSNSSGKLRFVLPTSRRVRR